MICPNYLKSIVTNPTLLSHFTNSILSIHSLQADFRKRCPNTSIYNSNHVEHQFQSEHRKSTVPRALDTSRNYARGNIELVKRLNRNNPMRGQFSAATSYNVLSSMETNVQMGATLSKSQYAQKRKMKKQQQTWFI
ncbi:hypothetical protein DLAC_02972 [Tieghemostelium lacteum]|uniref:Uncharacterized protein n=1 Tax=Tieghemostelium lacteum TaxID=361077 RepID=A0A152A3U4_TIELA|nr:hypothetical protein DLAC_02972 [Tieghemostelium lacteum]|eukprot:KYR00908.1 hypothetical protein DLAC_02972 [Tieghemostelium lacteum]